MHLLAVGLNHHTAPIELREKATFGPEIINQALTDLLYDILVASIARPGK